MSSLLCYDSDSASSDEIIKYDPEDDIRETEQTMLKHKDGKLRLPPPKKKQEVPVPPPPMEVIPPTIAKIVTEASKEKPQEIEVDLDELRTEGLNVAERNAIVRDRSQFNRVGYDREKSQLTYLAKLDEETRGEFEEQMKKATRAKVATKRMYGW